MSERQNSRDDYLRVRIEVRLSTDSPLHCGDGGALAAKHWHGREPLGSEGHINTICKGRFGAYIPASTLRGSLRERCADPSRLFGEARGDAGRAGAVRAYDAQRLEPDPALPDEKVAKPPGDQYWNVSTRTTLRNGVALDPVTGTADEGKLFTFEIVPAGQVFECIIEADRIDSAELAELLALIDGWDGTAQTAVGRGRSRGWGRVRIIQPVQVSVLTTEGLTKWATGNGQSPPGLTPETAGPVHRAPAPSRSFGFRLAADGPLLVNDAGRVLGRKKAKNKAPAKDKNQDAVPHLEYMRTAGHDALVPGSTLRGALRAQAWRILATIAHQHHATPFEDARERTKPLLTELFGTEGRRSLLWIGDAVATATRDHPQTFSAVDRFTGAVAQETQKIYSVIAADCPALCGDASLDLAARRILPGDWWKGLLLLLVRDLYEGDLILGWGKSRGYGAVRLTLQLPGHETFSDFAALLTAVRQRYGDTAPQTWLQALHDQVRAASPSATQGAAA